MQATKFIYASGVMLLLGYLVLSWVGIQAGLVSPDALGMIRTVTERLQTGDFAISRPPGHPLNEFWMLPAAAWIMDGGKTLSSETYLFYQLVGGGFCLVIFWLLLRELPLSPACRLLAAACLVFSPQFLIESSDGEEFLWGTAFVLATVLFVARLSAGKMVHPRLGWGLAVACAVAASGYRPEFGAIALGIVFWTLLASDRSWAEKVGLGILTAVLVALLWGPLWFHHGAHGPWAIPFDPKVRVVLGLYKMAFNALGVTAMFFAVVFFLQTRDLFRIVPPFGKDILGYWLPWLVVIFFGIFFIYPTKVSVVFPGVAFLILLLAGWAKRWVWVCFVVGCLSTLLVQFDCFDHRVWVGLKLKSGLWEQALLDKPAYQGPKLVAVSRLANQGRHVIIANLWPWDLTWQRAHTPWPGVALSAGVSSGWPIAYQVGPGVVMSRGVLDEPSLLQTFAQSGYDVWIDEDVYREVFMRYTVTGPVPQTALIGGVTCRLVDLH